MPKLKINQVEAPSLEFLIARYKTEVARHQHRVTRLTGIDQNQTLVGLTETPPDIPTDQEIDPKILITRLKRTEKAGTIRASADKYIEEHTAQMADARKRLELLERVQDQSKDIANIEKQIASLDKGRVKPEVINRYRQLLAQLQKTRDERIRQVISNDQPEEVPNKTNGESSREKGTRFKPTEDPLFTPITLEGGNEASGAAAAIIRILSEASQEHPIGVLELVKRFEAAGTHVTERQIGVFVQWTKQLLREKKDPRIITNTKHRGQLGEYFVTTEKPGQTLEIPEEPAAQQVALPEEERTSEQIQLLVRFNIVARALQTVLPQITTIEGIEEIIREQSLTDIITFCQSVIPTPDTTAMDKQTQLKITLSTLSDLSSTLRTNIDSLVAPIGEDDENVFEFLSSLENLNKIFFTFGTESVPGLEAVRRLLSGETVLPSARITVTPEKKKPDPQTENTNGGKESWEHQATIELRASLKKLLATKGITPETTLNSARISRLRIADTPDVDDNLRFVGKSIIRGEIPFYDLLQIVAFGYFHDHKGLNPRQKKQVIDIARQVNQHMLQEQKAKKSSTSQR